MSCACFSKSELDKCLFLLGKCELLRAPGSVPTRFVLSRARVSSSFLFFAFTSSPHCHNSLTCRGLRVKTFDLYYTVNHLRKLLWFSSLWVKECGSQAFTLFFTPFSQGAFPQSVHHGGRGVAKPCGEGKNAKAFTLNELIMNELEPMGEGVKAKDEKLLTCACVRARVEAGGEETRGGVPPTQKNERGIDRKRGAVGENVRGVFRGWAEESGEVGATYSPIEVYSKKHLRKNWVC